MLPKHAACAACMATAALHKSLLLPATLKCIGQCDAGCWACRRIVRHLPDMVEAGLKGERHACMVGASSTRPFCSSTKLTLNRAAGSWLRAPVKVRAISAMERLTAVLNASSICASICSNMVVSLSRCYRAHCPAREASACSFVPYLRQTCIASGSQHIRDLITGALSCLPSRAVARSIVRHTSVCTSIVRPSVDKQVGWAGWCQACSSDQPF